MLASIVDLYNILTRYDAVYGSNVLSVTSVPPIPNLPIPILEYVKEADTDTDTTLI